jgi:hypothetical protein
MLPVRVLVVMLGAIVADLLVYLFASMLYPREPQTAGNEVHRHSAKAIVQRDIGVSDGRRL